MKLAVLLIDAAITVHRELGPGLLESVYQLALKRELELRGLHVLANVPVQLTYKGEPLGKAYEIDLLVEGEVIVENKAVEIMNPVFQFQVITYLKLYQKKLGYLINFNVPLLKDGFKRIVHNFLTLCADLCSSCSLRQKKEMIIDIQTLSPIQKQQWLQHAVAPRPICFASTIDKEGNINLSPFSFFNLFSSNPPIVIFSPARRVRDNTTKHTLENVLEVPEVVINIVDYEMVQQVSLASCEFQKGTNEFIKAGFTQEAASIVKPPMVKESKVKMECKVLEVKPLGTEGGAGNLVICEVLCMHADESILNDEGTMIDQRKLHHVARLGGDWYCKVDETNLFAVEKPNVKLGIGVDALPVTIRNSAILTGNNLGQLGNVHEYPVVDATYNDERLKNIIHYFSVNPEEMDQELHKYAKELLDAGKVKEAWQVLLAD